MAEVEEYRPDNWGQGMNPGEYILQLKVKTCVIRDIDKEKPFLQVGFVVIGENQEGGEFDSRVYLSKAAEWRARWFLKKFGYPEQYLDSEKPVIKRKEIEGLEGKVYAIFEMDNSGNLRCDIKKFDYINGTEIEEWLEKQRLKESQDEVPLSKTDADPTKIVDVNDDIKHQPPQREPGDDEFDELNG
jgi:hypothetical protein